MSFNLNAINCVKLHQRGFSLRAQLTLNTHTHTHITRIRNAHIYRQTFREFIIFRSVFVGFPMIHGYFVIRRLFPLSFLLFFVAYRLQI